MRQVFVIEMGNDRLSVAVHDDAVGNYGRVADVTSRTDDPVLKFCLDDGNDGYTEYTIDWDEAPLRMRLLDVLLADGSVNNSEWGWVVPASEDF